MGEILADAILIGGANGAGKTTFARQLLPLEYPEAVFLNADEIQRQSGPLSHPVEAGRELLRRLEARVQEKASFVLETTLASSAHARKISGWKAEGYRVILYFIEVPSADFAVARVSRRVALGGHEVPEADIRRRFSRGIMHFEKTYKPLVDEWYHWRSDDNGLSLIDDGRR